MHQGSYTYPSLVTSDVEERVETIEYDSDGRVVKRTATTKRKPAPRTLPRSYWGGGFINTSPDNPLKVTD